MINFKKSLLTLCAVAMLSALPLSACVADKPDVDNRPVEKVETVYYYDFGAKGDGKTDDFAAIKATHEYANEHGCKVSVDEGDRYYIGAHTDTIVVKTDTDWTGAQFIIDDSEVAVNDRGWYVFEVASDTPSYKIDLPKDYSLKEGQTNLGLEFETPVLLRIVNSDKKDYIRYGLNVNNGSDRQEIILVDQSGNVDESTPILWDYDRVTSMTAYSTDDKPVTVQGGTFTTIANTAATSSNYYARGIRVTRSNTVVRSVTHYITGEGDHGSPYTGFFVVNYANHVTIESCVLTGHKTYINIKPTGAVSQGTYDTQAANCNDVLWLNCTQSNSITDTTYWGVMASNFCKNLKMQGCNLSRFDAHQGVYNATITDSELGQNLSIIGAGKLYLENVTRTTGTHFVQLRTDYGSTWRGEIIFKDCTLKSTSNACHAIEAVWTDWNFGYQCYLPAVTVDNFKVEGADRAYLYSAVTSSTAAQVNKSSNPLIMPEKAYVYNENTVMYLSLNNSDLFNGVDLVKN